MSEESYTGAKCKKQIDNTWNCDLFLDEGFVEEPYTESLTFITPMGKAVIPAGQIESWRIIPDEERSKLNIRNIQDIAIFRCHAVNAKDDKIDVTPSKFKMMTKSVTKAGKNRKHLYLKCSDPLKIL